MPAQDTFYRAGFTIPDLIGPFQGWTKGETWNGWACPRFQFDTAMQITEAWNALKDPHTGRNHKARYDEDQDAFCFYDLEWQLTTAAPDRAELQPNRCV